MDQSLCPFCGAAADYCWTAKVLGRYEAPCLRCPTCGSAHLAEITWLDEAYSSAIASTDVGLVARSMWTANLTTVVLRRWFSSAQRFCDFGGGTGLFTRLMRDAGFDFVWSDAFADNQFAAGFEAHAGEQFDLITAFEVLEHLEDPGDLVALARDAGASLLITTDLMPDPMPAASQWPYYSFETGQHIRFATAEGLRRLGAQFGYEVTSAGTVHLFAPFRVHPKELRLLTSRPVSKTLGPWLGRSSLLETDAQGAVRQLVGAQRH